MKSVKLKNSLVEIVEVETPVLDGFGAIVKIEGCGLCTSDIVKIRENSKNAILGHEIVGEIIEINSNTNFKKGDKIVMGHHYPCGNCEFCRNESYSMCETFKAVNIYPAGFSQFVKITEGHLNNTVFKVPNGFNPIFASFTEPLACCNRAIRRAGIPYKGANALTLGLGSIGILMAQLITAFGHNSYGFDINPNRQEFAKNFGIEFDKNLKYDVIFMTSGSSKAIDTALSFVKNGGKIIVFSSIENELGYLNNDIYYRELSVIGSYSPSPVDLKNAYNTIINGKIKLDNISTIYNLENIQNAVDDTVSNKIYKAYIKI